MSKKHDSLKELRTGLKHLDRDRKDILNFILKRSHLLVQLQMTDFLGSDKDIDELLIAVGDLGKKRKGMSVLKRSIELVEEIPDES